MIDERHGMLTVYGEPNERAHRKLLSLHRYYDHYDVKPP